MSVYVDIRVNSDVIGQVAITRIEGEDAGPVSTYRWDYLRDGELVRRGKTIHLGSDGAMVLVHRVLSQIHTLQRMEAVL